MGRYWGSCPKCKEPINFRDENTVWAEFLDEEYDRGFQDAIGEIETREELEQQNESLRNLLGANYRVMREEIRQEMERTKDGIPID